MHAYVLHGPQDLRKETREESAPNADEVVIDIRRVGICGSDVHYYQHFQIGDFIPRAPLVLGHEFSGVVIRTGADVTSIKVGQRVTVEPSMECGQCAYCRSGRYNLCNNLRFFGTAATVPHIDGGFGERVTAPASHCYVLDDALDFGAGALVEPMAVGAQAVRRVGSVSGARVLITGGGTIGQMVLAMAHATGATDITMADPAEYARTFALEHGAQRAVDPTETDAAARLFSEGGFDVVFEASGSPAALSFCYRVAAKGARVAQIGTLPAEVTLPANLVMSKELTVFGSFRYAHVYPTVLEMMVSGRIAVQDMISQVFPYDKMQTAMDKAVSKDHVIKVQVERG